MQNETFELTVTNNIAAIKFRRHFLFRMRDLTTRDQIFDCLDMVSKDDAVKVIILAGAPDAKSKEEYFDFFNNAKRFDKSEIALHRMLNIVSQIMIKLIELDKFVIYVNSGYILSYFLNIGLACDHRIIADNAIIQNPSIELGMLSNGGGAYFLPKIVGKSRTYEILLSHEDMTAADALKTGLVDNVVPEQNLEKTAMKVAERFSAVPSNVMTGTKRLVNYYCKDLKNYMDIENKEFITVLETSDEWKFIL